MGKKKKQKNIQIGPTVMKDGLEETIYMRVEEEVETVEFDVWWVLRQDKIPGHHMKEVIKADMMARGLSDKESLEDFDAALKQYGIKL
jgi:hypothetical protein